MATPLIEVIESCEQDIERFRSDLQTIIAEADEDGVRDDEEAKEIKSFEDSIADLEKYTQEKRTEFENNHAEWDGLASKVSDLMDSCKTLADWGEPNLKPVDQRITEMNTVASKMFYRDAITAYKAAQTLIDPLTDNYDKQSAAQVTYLEELDLAQKRVSDCRSSQDIDTDIDAALNQIETDFISIEALVDQRDSVEALSALRTTAEEITRVEGQISDNEQAKEVVQRAYEDLVNLNTDAEVKLAPYEDLLLEIATDFSDGSKQFGELMDANKLDQASLVLEQTETSINIALDQIPTREAAAKAEEERLAAQNALLEAERDKLASDLSASPPKGALWKLYEWKDGDTFDKLAKDSEVKTADVLMGFPNNKKASDYYNTNNELPAGTLVCVIDPTVQIFEMKVDGTVYYLTEDVLAGFAAENNKLLSGVKTNLNTLFLNLEAANKTAYEARHMAGWLTRYMTGWDVAEPADAREKARSSVKALDGSFNADNADKFGPLVVTAAKDCQLYKAALQTWIAQMQGELKSSMETLEFYDKVAKTCAVVAIVTVTAPASISVGALYTFGSVGSAAITAGGAAAGLSLFSDSITNIGSAALGNEKSIVSFPEMIKKAAKAGVTTGFSAALFGGLFSKLGPAIATRISSVSVVESQAVRLLANPFWSGKIVDLVKVTEAGAKIAQASGGTIHISKLAPAVTPVIVESYLKLFGRIAWGESVALRGYIGEFAMSCIDNNPKVLESPTEDAAAAVISNDILDDGTINGIFDAIMKEHEGELETMIADGIAGLNLDDLADGTD